MYLRAIKRLKDGKEHRYFTVVESVRVAGHPHPIQKPLLYLGELNDSQQAAWTKSLTVFNTARQTSETLSLFPEDRTPVPGPLPALLIKWQDYQLSRPRQYGACWLALELWRQLELDAFWERKLGRSREGTDWAQTLLVSVAYRLIAPGSEWKCWRLWYERSAMADLLGPEFTLGNKDQLYQVLDRLLAHRDDLFAHLRDRWKDLFGAQYELLLYDLTSTYFEGAAEANPKADYGYSRDHRPDCKQLVLALVITPEGFPLGYEVLPGNTLDKTTWQGMIERLEKLHGPARRIWIMDRGIPTKEQLEQMRQSQPPVWYLVGTPRAQVKTTHSQWEALPWQKVKDSVEVKLFREKEELYVVAKSSGRQQKELAMRRRKLARLLWTLRGMRRETSRDRLFMRLGAAKHKAGRAYSYVKIQLPKEEEPVNRQTFGFALDRAKLQEAELYDGHYLLRSNLADREPQWLWQLYTLLVEIEAVFRSFKNDLMIRPVYHQLESRSEAHIFVCFLAYCLWVTLKKRLQGLAPGLTPRSALDQLAGIQMLDVQMPTTDDRWLILTRYTQPSLTVQLLLERLKWQLPEQPPPRLSERRQLELPAQKCSEDLLPTPPEKSGDSVSE
jgi:transposase